MSTACGSFTVMDFGTNTFVGVPASSPARAAPAGAQAGVDAPRPAHTAARSPGPSKSATWAPPEVAAQSRVIAKSVEVRGRVEVSDFGDRPCRSESNRSSPVRRPPPWRRCRSPGCRSRSGRRLRECRSTGCPDRSRSPRRRTGSPVIGSVTMPGHQCRRAAGEAGGGVWKSSPGVVSAASIEPAKKPMPRLAKTFQSAFGARRRVGHQVGLQDRVAHVQQVGVGRRTATCRA